MQQDHDFPFTVGTVLGKGFGTFFKNLPSLLLMAVIVYAPLIVYGFVAKNPLEVLAEEGSDAALKSSLLFLGIITLGGLLLQQLLTASVTYSVVEELNGRHASVGKSLGVGLQRLLPSALVALITGVLAMLGMVLVFPLGVLGLVIAAIYALVIILILYVAVPASVIERPGIGGALSRSAFLTKGFRWSIFAVLIVLGVFNWLVGRVLESALIDTATQNGTEGVNPDDWTMYIAITVGTELVLGALGAVMTATVYVGLRREKDGVGVGELASVFE